MSINTVEVIDRGLRCLSEHLGSRETEIFITTLLRERFDYTEWRRVLTNDINTFEDLDRFVDESKEKLNFSGNPQLLL